MAKVSIDLEEYKALLVKEKPSDIAVYICSAIFETIKDHSRIVDKDSYSSDFKGLEFFKENDALKEICATIYALDREGFIDLYKELASNKKQSGINELNAEYMRKIKELKNSKGD